MSGICIDLGASGSRVTSDNAVIHILSNEMVTEDRTAPVDLEVKISGTDRAADFAQSMDIIIDKTSGTPCKAFPARAIIGELANRYSPTVNRPSVMMNKSGQNINLINIIVAVAQQVYVNGYDGQPITIYLALPPLEVSKTTQEDLSNMLSGTYHIILEKLKTEFDISIGTVKCYAESYMALAAFFFDFPACTMKPEVAARYGKGYVMSLDIGASTTDLSIAKNMQLQEKSGQTIKTGGNIIEMHIANSIRAKYGFDPTHEDLLTAVKEGRLPMGNGYVDVSDMLRRAKREFARTIVNELQNYFRLVNIPLQSIRAIIVSGGGSLVSSYTDNEGKLIITCESVSEFITRELNNIVENIDVVAMEDARTANLRGLFIRLMMDKAAEKKAAQAQSTTS